MSIRMDPLTLLPAEVSLDIFSYLHPSDLACCCQVNSTWKAIASDNTLWAKTAEKILGVVPKGVNIQAYTQWFEFRKLKSNEKIIKCIQDFANDVFIGQNAIFKCTFFKTGNNSCEGDVVENVIKIEIKSKLENKEEFVVVPEYFAVNGIGDGSLIAPQSSYKSQSLTLSQERYSTSNERVFICRTRRGNGSFEGTLHFPVLSNVSQTDMEIAVESILKRRLEEMATQYAEGTPVNRHLIAKGAIVVAGIGLFLAAALKKWHS